MIKDGFSMPYIQINGKMRLFGGMSSKDIYKEIQRLVNYTEK
ncbi:hypothetical protein [Anaeromicrobium sediminis]|nr:hypothetical protein [Anaeromicrobium sediminis]